MPGITARRIVAPMQDFQSVWNESITKLPRNSIRAPFFSGSRKAAVAGPLPTSFPRPALIEACHVHAGPEPNARFFDGRHYSMLSDSSAGL